MLLAVFTASYPLFLLLRAPIEPDAGASVVIFLPLLVLPAVIAIVGLVRGSTPVVGAAGVLCFLPAIMSGWPIIPFAGFLAITGLSRGPLPSGHELWRGIGVSVLGMAAWFVPYLGKDPLVPLDAPRVGLGIAMAFATISLAIGRATGERAIALAR